MIASIDLSLRSTGVTVLDQQGNFVDCLLVTPSPKQWNDEELLIYIAEQIVDFLNNFKLSAIAIEGLSYNSFSSEKDKIGGNFWHLRCVLKELYPGVPIGIIPVTSWRSFLLSKEEQREIKKIGAKDGIKKACVYRLPKNVEEQFSSYMSKGKFPSKCLYDLSDAYHLGKYRVTLGDFAAN